jgi:hypothetical protein
VSIIPFLRDQPFEPEQIEAMSAALAQARAALGLSDSVDARTEIVARHVIEAAQCGMRTKTALYLATMLAMQEPPPKPGPSLGSSDLALPEGPSEPRPPRDRADR